MKTLFVNGIIHTMDENCTGNAVLCTDGTIAAVGTREQLEKEAGDAEVIDLKGKVMLPGFIDPHSHFTQVASGLMQADLDGADSTEEIGHRLNQFVQEHQLKEGAWVIAKNYDTNLMPQQKNPGIAELDQFIGDRPLVIQQKSGHMGLFNSAAMKYLGITMDTPDPQGGRIGREDGHLTGYLEENAYFTYQKKTPMPSMEEFLTAYQKAQQLYASYGITTMQEGMLVEQMLPLYQLLYASDLLKLDLVSYPDMQTYDAAVKMFPDLSHGYVHHMRIGGIKIFLDGSPQGRTAWMRTPYLNSENDCGYGTMKDEEVLAACRKALQEKKQLLAHCNGDAAAQQYIRCVKQIEEEHPEFKQLRPVIIHAQLLGLDQIQEAQKLGMTASFFVAHVYHWGDIHIRNFGFERASQISPAASALHAHLPFTFHQDAPVIQPNMIETLWCAVNRITKDGVVLGSEERISIHDALRAVTLTAAYQYGEENEKGSITPGKKADFVVLDQDPYRTAEEQIKDLQVMMTIKSGEIIYQK